ncbi:MAG: hypothetical protein WB870_14545 [Gallionellaceae bacterium]
MSSSGGGAFLRRSVIAAIIRQMRYVLCSLALIARNKQITQQFSLLPTETRLRKCAHQQHVRAAMGSTDSAAVAFGYSFCKPVTTGLTAVFIAL